MQVTPNPGKPGRGPAAITTPGKERHNASLLFVSGTSGLDLTPPMKYIWNILGVISYCCCSYEYFLK